MFLQLFYSKLNNTLFTLSNAGVVGYAIYLIYYSSNDVGKYTTNLNKIEFHLRSYVKYCMLYCDMYMWNTHRISNSQHWFCGNCVFPETECMPCLWVVQLHILLRFGRRRYPYTKHEAQFPHKLIINYDIFFMFLFHV